ncbi:hypothetical protein [Filobacillus milosensis]|uniref:hypothetical protein n=1 Tax=Filobacillus milosensis TaxID=94137 RepID=UPI001890C68A|nr:hypothetical protein [Filobacillus milosensis]
MDHRTTYAIPGGLILGLGIGIVYNQVAAGLLIGLGSGLLLSALIGLIEKMMKS